MSELASHPFAALAHPIRREMVERLSGGATTVGQASRDLGVSKPTITRHLKLLEEAGVVTRGIDGQSHRLTLRPETLAEASAWIERQRTRWEAPLRHGRRVPGGANGPKMIQPPGPMECGSMGEPPDPGRSCLLHTLGHYHIIGHIERTPEPCLPENPAYEPIENDEITIIGKVMGLWRAPV